MSIFLCPQAFARYNRFTIGRPFALVLSESRIRRMSQEVVTPTPEVSEPVPFNPELSLPLSTRHPIAFFFIFWGEFAERASYYGMRRSYSFI